MVECPRAPWGQGGSTEGQEDKQGAQTARMDRAAACGVCAIYSTPSQLKAPGPQCCPHPEGSTNFPSRTETKLKSPALYPRSRSKVTGLWRPTIICCWCIREGASSQITLETSVHPHTLQIYTVKKNASYLLSRAKTWQALGTGGV